MTNRRNTIQKDLVRNAVYEMKRHVTANEVYDLIVEDTVFVASDENQSIATTQNTLDVKNGNIVIGE